MSIVRGAFLKNLVRQSFLSMRCMSDRRSKGESEVSAQITRFRKDGWNLKPMGVVRYNEDILFTQTPFAASRANAFSR